MQRSTRAKLELAIKDMNAILQRELQAECALKRFTLEEVRKIARERKFWQRPHCIVPNDLFAVVSGHSDRKLFINVEGYSPVSMCSSILSHVVDW